MTKTSILDAPSSLYYMNYMQHMMEVGTRIKCLSSERAQTKTSNPRACPDQVHRGSQREKGRYIMYLPSVPF